MSADVNWHNELRDWLQQQRKHELEEWESRVALDPSLVILQRDTSGTCDPAVFEEMDKADWSWAENVIGR
jgi:hypothetical protein